MSSRIADIAAALPGYDPAALRIDQAQAFLAQLCAPMALADREDLPLFDALGRVLADDIVAPFSVPPHDNSAMDGYAFDGARLDAANGRELTLRVVGTALAGTAWRTGLGSGEALKIMTGAMMPPGLDTVVPHEHCTVDGERVRFAVDALRRGANRRLAGEDLMAGRAALRQGDRVTPAALGLLASLGLAAVPVRRRLRVAYFSTGDELLGPGDAPRPGAVFDSNRYTLLALLTRLGCAAIDLGHVPDEPAALEDALRRAAVQADAVLTSGGVSAGDADHTCAVMRRVADMAFWRIAMRPGRPMAVGWLPGDLQAELASSARGAGTGSYQKDSKGAVLFGLPGNPVAAMVSFLALVRPALLQLMGCSASSAVPPPLLRARSMAAIRKRPGRTEYQRGFVTSVPGALPQVRIAGNQGSGVLSSMAQANGLVVLHHAQGDVAAGEEVDVMLFEGVV